MRSKRERCRLVPGNEQPALERGGHRHVVHHSLPIIKEWGAGLVCVD